VLRALPRGFPVRASFTFTPGEKPWPNRAARSMTNRLIARRFGSTRWFFSIRTVRPEQLALARGDAVEVMCHPGWEDEYQLLMSDAWAGAIDGLRLGSFADL
jgi:hypothetical protein